MTRNEAISIGEVMSTELIEVRKANPRRKGEKDADVVFIRKGEDGCEYTVFACVFYEAWQQWGAERQVLCDNVDDVQAWRRGNSCITCPLTEVK